MAFSSFSHFFTLIALLFASISPIDARYPRRQHPPKFALSKCSLPLSNGTASLPAPDGLKVKAVTLGRGIQNYTCEPGSKAPPKAIGAVATLYDVSPFLSLLPPSEGENILALLPNYLVSLNLDALHNSFLPVQGHHFFDANGTPVFDLGKVGLFRGKKSASIAAPEDSFRGPYDQGVGAVDWLQLCAVEGSKSLKRTYRVETAGGKPPASCEGQPAAIQVEYASQYWFYS